MKIKQANRFFKNGEYRKALDIYSRLNRQEPFNGLLSFNIELCNKRLSSSKSNQGANKPLHGKLPIPVTLTSISSRLPRLIDVINTLHEQTLQPSKILVHLSEDPYLLDKGVRANDPYVKKLQEFPLVELKWVSNTGPYRKIIPLVSQLIKRNEKGYTAETVFVTVDDDTLYPTDFLERLYGAYCKYDCVIAFRGRSIVLDESGDYAAYGSFSLGSPEPQMRNIPTGKDGVLYSSRFFTNEFCEVDDAVAIAPTADDLWIKWHCALNGIPSVILNPEASTSDYRSFPVVDYSDDYRDVSLYRKYNKEGSLDKNSTTIQALEKFYKDKWGYNLLTLLSEESISQLL